MAAVFSVSLSMQQKKIQLPKSGESLIPPDDPYGHSYHELFGHPHAARRNLHSLTTKMWALKSNSMKSNLAPFKFENFFQKKKQRRLLYPSNFYPYLSGCLGQPRQTIQKLDFLWMSFECCHRVPPHFDITNPIEGAARKATWNVKTNSPISNPKKLATFPEISILFLSLFQNMFLLQIKCLPSFLSSHTFQLSIEPSRSSRLNPTWSTCIQRSARRWLWRARLRCWCHRRRSWRSFTAKSFPYTTGVLAVLERWMKCCMFFWQVGNCWYNIQSMCIYIHLFICLWYVIYSRLNSRDSFFSYFSGRYMESVPVRTGKKSK